VIGVIWLFFLTGTTFSVIAFLGVVVLSGIIVNNGIVMVHYIRLVKETDNLPTLDAVILGAKRRLRPVLMTALTTICAMLPLAAGIGEGAEIRMPMARAVIGGLAAGTILTLFVIPVVYVILDRFATRRSRK
jgi:HAE1 family hydrophobic/amphiphilic exporter-1